MASVICKAPHGCRSSEAIEVLHSVSVRWVTTKLTSEVSIRERMTERRHIMTVWERICVFTLNTLSRFSKLFNESVILIWEIWCFSPKGGRSLRSYVNCQLKTALFAGFREVLDTFQTWLDQLQYGRPARSLSSSSPSPPPPPSSSACS